MKLDNIEQLLYDELSDAKLSSNTIMINGGWGIGKSYAIDNFIRFVKTYNAKEEFSKNEIADIKKEHNLAVSKKNMLEGMLAVKVSLFGKKSIEKLNQELIQDLKIMSKVFRGVHRIVNTVLGSVKFEGFSVKLPDLSFVVEKLYKGIDGKVDNGNRVLIFFDDLERIEDDKFFIDVLGFIENLSTKSGVNIIIACNEDKLKENKKYQDYKEKVVDVTFSFDKPSKRAIDSFIGDYKEYHNEKLYEYLINLRTLQKTKKKLLPILRRVKGMRNEDRIKNEVFARLFFCMLEKEERHFSKISEERNKNNKGKDDWISRKENEPSQLLGEAVNKCAKVNFINDWYSKAKITDKIFDYINDKSKLEDLVSYVDAQIESYKNAVEPYCLNDDDKTKYYQNFYEQMKALDKGSAKKLCEINYWVDMYSLPIEIDNELFINKLIDGFKDASIDAVESNIDNYDNILDYYPTQKKLVADIKKRILDAAIKNNFDKMVGFYNDKNYDELHVEVYNMTKNYSKKIEEFDKVLEHNNMFFPLEHKMTWTPNHQYLISSVFRYLYSSQNKDLLNNYIKKFEEFMENENADNTDRIRTRKILEGLAVEIANMSVDSLKKSLVNMNEQDA